MTGNMYIATVAWVLLSIGVLFRKRRGVHVSLMITGIVLDIGLVLYLQVTREAVQTALEFSLKPLEQVHIGFSTLALVLYFPVLFLGFKLLLGPTASLRKLHITLGSMAYVFRSAGFIFMFSMLQ
jgi:hypothetical protein